MSGHDMGKAFEELLRRFNDASPAGERYTPRDVIHLMVDILFDGDEEFFSIQGLFGRCMTRRRGPEECFPRLRRR